MVIDSVVYYIVNTDVNLLIYESDDNMEENVLNILLKRGWIFSI